MKTNFFLFNIFKSSNAQLRELNINTIRFGVEGAKAIAEALIINTQLTKLEMRDNIIGDEGTKAIAEALKINVYLKKLDIGKNKIGDEGAKAIFDALKTEPGTTARVLSKTKLEKLSLSNNDFTADTIVYIVKSLIRNKTLTMVNLSLYKKKEFMEDIKKAIIIKEKIKNLKNKRIQMNLPPKLDILFQL